MRRTLAFAIIGALALLAALGSLPAVTEAAPAAQYGTYSGTLVATPQSTLPATLMLQVGGQTIPVTISSSTQVVNSQGSALSLSAMVDGDSLTVTGDLNLAGGINATEVQDLSQSVTTPPTGYQYTVTGTLATEFSGGLCLANASVVSGAYSPNIAVASPCVSGEFPVYLTGGTTFENASGSAIAVGNLQINDSLNTSGVLSGGQFTASLVQDLSQSTTTPPTGYQYTVSGTLATEFSGGLCLADATVLSGAYSPNVTVASPCVSGEFPVYLSNTTFEDANGNAIALGNLQINDSLQAAGTLSSSQFTASLVQDLSQSTTTPTGYQYTVTGTLAQEYSSVLCLANANVVSGAVTPNLATASPCPSGELPVYLSNTTFENANGTAIALGNLQINDSLQATGTLSSSQFIASMVQDLSQSTTTIYTAPTTVTPVATTLVGTVQSTSFNGSNRCFTIQVQQGPVSGTITVCLQGNSQILLHNASRGKYTALRRGQTVTVVGMYNKHNHRWTSTQRVRIH